MGNVTPNTSLRAPIDDPQIKSLWVVYGIRLNIEGSPFRYIGMTSNGIAWRLSSHIRKATRENQIGPLYDWIRKHSGGIMSEVIEVCPEEDWSFLGEREKYWIAHYRDIQGSLNDIGRPQRLLNISDGGVGGSGSGELHWNFGKTRPESVKLKIAATRLERGIPAWNKGVPSPQTAGANNSYYGKTHSFETREKMSKASHARWHVAKHKIKSDCRWCNDK